MNASAGSPVDGVEIDEEYSPLFGDIDKVFKNRIDKYNKLAKKHRTPHCLTRRFAIIGIIYAIVAILMLAINYSGEDFNPVVSFVIFSAMTVIFSMYLVIETGSKCIASVVFHSVFQIIITSINSNIIQLEVIYSVALITLCWLANIKFGYTRSWSRNRSMARKLQNLYALYKSNAYEEIDIRQMLIKLVDDNIDQNHNDIVNDYALFGDKLTSLAKIRK